MYKLQNDFPIHIRFILVLITDTLSTRHSFLQVLNMLLGPLAILTCGILLLVLSEKHHVRVIYSRLVDPIICCFLFLSYLFMISIPSMELGFLFNQNYSICFSSRCHTSGFTSKTIRSKIR
jgi:hypothetical protein